ncbi:MAG: lasso peptide biosynthesis PqqD family chaperone [Hominisplanchenecus sp.]
MRLEKMEMLEQTVLKRKAGIMTADMDGSTVMMDIETGKYYNLGETGGAVWELLEEPMSVGDLVDRLLQEYKVSRENCMEDVRSFLTALMERGLIAA